MIFGSIVSGMQELGHSEVVHGERCHNASMGIFCFFEIVNVTTLQGLPHEKKLLKSIKMNAVALFFSPK